MVSRMLLGALAGAAMLAASSGPSAAFTLSQPSLTQAVATADVQHVWWDRWGRWHPNRRWWWGRHYGWGWGWRPRYYAYAGPRCWTSPWGHVHCGGWW